MKISRDGLEFLKAWEGCKLRVYKDQAGLPTIGVGHLLTTQEKRTGLIMLDDDPIEYDDGITLEQALALLDQDLDEYEGAVARLFVHRTLAQYEFDALTAFCFNIGVNGFAGSTCVKRLKAGNVDGGLEAWSWWIRITVKGKPVVSNGLVKRRNAEIALYRDGDYSGRP